MIKVYSFDVFDTTLTRVTARPKDIFFLVGSRLEKVQPGLPEKFVKNFAVIRERSALRLRLLSRQEDITINDIYAYIGKCYGLKENVIANLIKLETDTELESAYPIQGTLLAINRLRESEARIIFTSDNYLPAEVVKKMLLKVGAFRPGDNLYVSGAAGAAKIWGTLYRHILENESIGPEELSHHGDNPYSDIFVPAKMGIQIFNMPTDKLDGFLNEHRIYGFARSAMAAIKRLYLK